MPTITKNGKVMGRPKVNIDLAMVERLANIQCTIEEIAAVMKIPYSTLTSREDFSATYKAAVQNGKASLRRMQFKLAEKSAGMAIWLGKQYLGQKDQIEITNDALLNESFEFAMPHTMQDKYKRFYNN